MFNYLVDRSRFQTEGYRDHTGYAELTWRRDLPGFSAAMEGIYRDRIFANATNTQAAAQYALANMRLAYSHRIAGWKLGGVVGVDNVTNTRYEGSVIVNESNGLFYEPAPRQNYMVRVNASYAF